MTAKRTQVSDATSKEVHAATLRLIASIGSFFASGDRTTNEIILVPMTIFARIVRVHEATVGLLKDGYVSEAAVLTLTAFELRIDLLDTASDINRATAWIEHGDVARKPDSVRATLNRLFRKAETDRMYEIFRYLSGIKHGNSLLSDLAFPISKRHSTLMVTTGPIDNAAMQAFSRAIFAYSTYQLIWAGQVLNKVTGRYAIIPKPEREKVHEHYMSLRTVQTEFLQLCRQKVRSRQSFFGMKERRSGQRVSQPINAKRKAGDAN